MHTIINNKIEISGNLYSSFKVLPSKLVNHVGYTAGAMVGNCDKSCSSTIEFCTSVLFHGDQTAQVYSNCGHTNEKYIGNLT